jgi:SNF2 family DNA or RNA helicase
MLLELDRNSPKCEQPKDARIVLKPHQLTLLHACRNFEQGIVHTTPPSSSASSHLGGGEGGGGEYMRSRLGIMGDKVGSGKSFVILSLMMSDIPARLVDEYDHLAFAENTVRIRRRHHMRLLETSLLVIPHNLVRQWQDYIDVFLPSRLRTIVVARSRTLDLIADIGNYDLIVVTSTFYPMITRMSEGLRFKRVFFDEVDSIKIINCMFIDACTYWFVTASYNNILYPLGRTVLDRHTNRYVQMSTGIRMSGFVRTLFHELSKSLMPPFTVDAMIVKNTDAFVDASANLPELVEHTIHCLQPREISILTGLVDHQIMQHLNANDIRGAISFIAPSRRQTESNIVDALIESYDRKVRNILAKIEYHRTLEYDDEAVRSAEIARLNVKKNDMELKIKAIQERVRTSTLCPVCYEEIVVGKCILPCCQNVFCIRCITRWFEQNDSCPLCKAHSNVSAMFVVTPPPEQQQPTQQPSSSSSSSPEPPLPKIQTLVRIIKSINESAPGRRIIIFSAFDSTFDEVGAVLTEHAIPFDYLHGTCTHIALMTKRYKDPKDAGARVLLANATNFGSGLNLENTTDVVMFHKFDSEIERQVIGRAQRPGRTAALNVWYLLHDNEIA